jgi:hypothetical protein
MLIFLEVEQLPPKVKQTIKNVFLPNYAARTIETWGDIIKHYGLMTPEIRDELDALEFAYMFGQKE